MVVGKGLATASGLQRVSRGGSGGGRRGATGGYGRQRAEKGTVCGDMIVAGGEG